VVLVYGPDRGLISERIARLITSAGADPADAFAVTRLDASVLEREPARLAEEAQAVPMFGGRRVVVVRDAGDRTVRAIGILLDLPEPAALVILEAGDLGPASKLRQTIERAKNAVAIPCYRDEGQTLERTVAALLREHRLEAAPDVLAQLSAHLGADRAVTRNEIEKLALYIGDRADRRVRPEDVAAVIAEAAYLGVDALVDAVLLGRPVEVARLLDQLFAEGEAAVALLRRTALDLKRLLGLLADLSEDADAARVVEMARPPIFFRRRPVFEAALRRWSVRSVLAALAALEESELACKSTGMPDELICRQRLVELAAGVSSVAG
jgi:DNA polymerase-3 subunit delta